MTKIKNFILGHKKIMIGFLALIVLLLGVSLFKSSRSSGVEISESETTLLKEKEFLNAVNESGKANSENDAKLYAEKQLPVAEVNVEVGDKVEKDQIIAKLDDSTIKQQIATKRALIASSKKSSSAQIKNAKDRLNDAIKNKKNGTNPSVTSASSAALAAYDQWQSAEKAYEDYKRAIAVGYDPQIAQEKANTKNIENSLDAAGLNFNQSKQKYDILERTIAENQDLANREDEKVDLLKDRSYSIEKRIDKLSKEVQEDQALLQSASGSSIDAERTMIKNQLDGLSEQKKSYDEILSRDPSNREAKIAIDEIVRKEVDLNNKLRSLGDAQGPQVDIAKINSRIEANNNELTDLKNSLANIKEDLADAQTNLAKYKAEVENAEKQLEPTNMEIEQQDQALKATNKNVSSKTEQERLADLARTDQLETLRKNASDLKHNYDNSLKALKVAQVAEEDEIKALKNNLSIAKSSSDESVNSIDIKNLMEDLDKTLIKAPISGTVTESNMIKGQVPTDFLAKIETVNRTIVKSQVKEFDVNNIKVGTEVEITSDAIGRDKVFKGEVESINPTPISSNSQQNKTSSNEVLYETTISLEDNNEIKPGMTVRVKYILDRQEDVFTIPTNAIYEKNNKNFIMYIDKGKGTKVIKEMEVFVSSENEFETVISSKNKLSGLRVINSTDAYSPGTEVQIVKSKDMKNAKGE